MTRDVVVVDANVLYGIEVTDLLATMATRHLFRPHWSRQILEEVARNLALRLDLDREAITRRLRYLNQALPSALVEVPLALVHEMPINEKDRHVLALAVHVEASTIVTENLRDFPSASLEPYGIEAVSPDSFVAALVEQHADAVLVSIDAMASRRRRQPRTRRNIIQVLSRYLPEAMALLDASPAGNPPASTTRQRAGD